MCSSSEDKQPFETMQRHSSFNQDTSTKFSEVEGSLTGPSPFNLQPALHMCETAQSTRGKRKNYQFCKLVFASEIFFLSKSHLIHANEWQSVGIVQHATARQLHTPTCSQQAVGQVETTTTTTKSYRTSKTAIMAVVHKVSDLAF